MCNKTNQRWEKKTWDESTQVKTIHVINHHYTIISQNSDWFMPYGYDKTRTERRCKNCQKLLYVFEVGKLCIECARKEPKK